MILRHSDVTPREIYWNRRKFLSASAATLGSLALSPFAEAAALNASKTGGLHNLGNNKLPPKNLLTSHNNYYEFGSGKDEPAKNAPKWKPDPAWPVRLEGEVVQPKTLGIAEILKLAPLEERIYRMRCVEGWSMVVPWIGIPLSALLKQVQPTGNAKFVAFESVYDTKAMLTPREAGIRLPYVEGLRLDEAMHPLTLLAVGLYGETLLNQNGAPMRLVVPWKYGFKGIKSIVRIRFVEKMPATTWAVEWPEAYGFYANVNPKKPHPRFDQDFEDRLDGSGIIGQGRRIRTEMFNGYGPQVAGLYSGMDLNKNY
ncbi:MAG: protein-methionine-sulfoxide reductase catalytic subunit MsrP [Acidobacteriota bacterium]|jgi:sulfoxide reductase catalytic subunit YedY